jgi:hypothetical protein
MSCAPVSRMGAGREPDQGWHRDLAPLRGHVRQRRQKQSGALRGQGMPRCALALFTGRCSAQPDASIGHGRLDVISQVAFELLHHGGA